MGKLLYWVIQCLEVLTFFGMSSLMHMDDKSVIY